MKTKVGQYFFKRNHGAWSIYQWEEITESSSSARHIDTVPTFEDALAQTFALNGWPIHSKIYRKY